VQCRLNISFDLFIDTAPGTLPQNIASVSVRYWLFCSPSL